jgi:radical SAM protein with 4Fe4S-binding SPASM domain
MNCGFCIRSKNKTSISLKNVEKILEEAKRLGYDTISMTGGEVYMHPNFYELVRKIVAAGFGFTLVSNGWNYEKYIPLLDYPGRFKKITFSLDGNKKTHDFLRTKGSYDRIMKAIKFFLGKTEVGINMCLNKFNFNQIEEVFKILQKAGVKYLNFSSIIPTGHNGKFILTDAEREKSASLIDNLAKDTFMNIRTLSGLRTLNQVEFCLALNLHSISINPNGKVSFCCDLIGDGAIIGDIKKDKLSRILERGFRISNFLKEKKFEQLKKKKFEGCNTCFFCNRYLKRYKNGI